MYEPSTIYHPLAQDHDLPRTRPQLPRPHRLRPHPHQARGHARSEPCPDEAFRPVEPGATAASCWATTFAMSRPVYQRPPLRTFPDGSIEGYWGEHYTYAQFEGGKYLESVHLPFAGIETLDQLDRSHFPSADWFDYSTHQGAVRGARGEQFAVCAGTPGDMDFINGISRARGMEQVMMDLATDNEVYLAIMEARFRVLLRDARTDSAGGRRPGRYHAHGRGLRQPARADDQHEGVRQAFRAQATSSTSTWSTVTGPGP